MAHGARERLRESGEVAKREFAEESTPRRLLGAVAYIVEQDISIGGMMRIDRWQREPLEVTEH